MSKFLLNETKVFRCDMESEAQSLLKAIKLRNDVIDYRISHKVKKDEEYVILKVKIAVNDEKDPAISYTEEV